MAPKAALASVREQSAPKGPNLIGLYAGHNPEELECPKAETRQWEANGLSFKSARGSDGCAEFLVEDPKRPERGYLHLWFGPVAKDHPQAAEGVVASIHPSSLPVYRPDDLPTCK